VLSEEGNDSAQRLSARRVWIDDPLDGTREFGELDRPDWAVHVALVIDGFLVAGAVALPDLLIAHPDWAGAALQAVAGSTNPPPDPARPAGTSPARGT
jgi:3'(2'), 5'-bisphosphate nucleotidase